MDKAAAAQIVTANGWLSRRTAEFRAAVIDRCHLKRFDAGSALYHAGDAPSGMFGLVSGGWLYRMPPTETIISIGVPGSWIGEAGAFGLEARMATISIAADAYVLHLSQSDFERLILDAGNCRQFAMNTVESLGEAITVINNLTQPDSEVRVAQRLLTFTGLFGATRQRALAVTQAELATLCGLSRQTMSKVIKGLVGRGIIAPHYRLLEIVDIDALRQLATEDERIWR